jgi:hypothetical protein
MANEHNTGIEVLFSGVILLSPILDVSGKGRLELLGYLKLLHTALTNQRAVLFLIGIAPNIFSPFLFERP